MMYVTDSMLHWAAENVLALRPRLLVDIGNGHRFHFNDAYLYITFAVLVLLLGSHLCYEAKERQSSLDHIPVYRASKWRWWFEAEDLLKESSAKVIPEIQEDTQHANFWIVPQSGASSRWPGRRASGVAGEVHRRGEDDARREA